MTRWERHGPAVRRPEYREQPCVRRWFRCRTASPTAVPRSWAHTEAAEQAPAGASLDPNAGEKSHLSKQTRGWKCVPDPGRSVSGALRFRGGRGGRSAVGEAAGDPFLPSADVHRTPPECQALFQGPGFRVSEELAFQRTTDHKQAHAAVPSSGEF